MDKLRKAKSFTNLRQYLFVCVCFLLLCASQAISDVPNVFVLWHSDNRTRVSFNCNAIIQGNGQINDNEIECKSTTTFFSYFVEPDTFEQNWANSEYPAMFDQNGEFLEALPFGDFCKTEMLDPFRFILNRKTDQEGFKLSDQQATEFKKNQGKRTNADKKEFFKRLGALVDLCEQPNLATVKEYVRVENSREERTCRMNHQTLTEVYSKITDNLWVNQTEPNSTPCRRVNVSTLRLPDDGSAGEWQFELRSFSLDKKATNFLGMSCAEIDENGTDLYTHRDDPVFLNCDYIE